MEGKYFFYKKKENILKLKNLLIVFELDFNYYLCYFDTRRFGTMHLFKKKEYFKNNIFINLGLDPFDKNFNYKYLQKKWKNKRKFIKLLLLDQDIVSGIGNIYASEILFLSKIHPKEIVKNLTISDYKNLINNTKKILKKSIKYKGTTFFSFYSLNKKKGNFFNKLQVYNRFNKKCFICNNLISKEFINKRGTYFCSFCQILK